MNISPNIFREYDTKNEDMILYISEALTSVFAYHKVRKAILFGSYSKGTAEINSDIDILVDSGLKGLEFVGLLEDAREAVQKDVDLIDISHIEEGAPLLSEIQNSGVVIYEA